MNDLHPLAALKAYLAVVFAYVAQALSSGDWSGDDAVWQAAAALVVGVLVWAVPNRPSG